MKTIEEIAADIRRQRELIDQNIRQLAELGSAEEILKKLQELRARREISESAKVESADL